jgi:hypothetical protein
MLLTGSSALRMPPEGWPSKVFSDRVVMLGAGRGTIYEKNR